MFKKEGDSFVYSLNKSTLSTEHFFKIYLF